MVENFAFALNRLYDYSDPSILDEVRRVASIAPDGALTTEVFKRHGRVSLTTIRRRFGSWENALRAAGLEDRFADQVGTRGSHAARRMSDTDVLDALRSLAKQLNKTELTARDVRDYLPFSDGVLRKRWGRLRAAIEAAGLRPNTHGRRYTDDECFENLLVVWTYLRRPPMYREMGTPPSTVGGKAYVKRFGSWNRALHAFVERVNKSSNDQANLNRSLHESVEDDAGAVPVAPRPNTCEEIRDIPLGLRFRVLKRDCFKCVLCGDHPARNPSCILHVDHVVPWSRGGKTREDNLRTLCASCNIGRGNRFTD